MKIQPIRTILSSLIVLSVGIATAQAQDNSSAASDNSMSAQKAGQEAPLRGYVKAHEGVSQPMTLLGGPMQIKLSQSGGDTHVALPAQRELDPHVFGTPAKPRRLTGYPVAAGVPAKLRGQENGHYTKLQKMTPFGNKTVTMSDASLQLQATDATATDAASTSDTVKMSASWKDKDGNTYMVKCCSKMASHGIDYPTFGGVVTNTLLHGSSGVGTPLMPTEYTYFAFWGMGQVMKNGKVLAQPRLIHGMLTENVRTKSYQLASDDQVDPMGKRMFHLMVPPSMPDMAHGTYKASPVDTGFTLPNGTPLPFWHVMFDNVQVSAQHG